MVPAVPVKLVIDALTIVPIPVIFAFLAVNSSKKISSAT